MRPDDRESDPDDAGPPADVEEAAATDETTPDPDEPRVEADADAGTDETRAEDHADGASDDQRSATAPDESGDVPLLNASSDPSLDTEADVLSSADRALGALSDGSRRRTLYAVLAVTALSLLVRFVGLGTRVFHWDEGRVGYWILRYAETGEYAYRPIVHGPFIAIVNELLFAVLPASDFLARAPVALVGGLLPLTAWLFRDRLRDSEMVALALLFAANPLLVYYSRFMRSDLLVASFAVFALAFTVRAIDARDARLLLPAGASLGLAFTTKENALIYVLCYLGALALVLDGQLIRETARGPGAMDVLTREWPARARAGVAELAPDGSFRSGVGRLLGGAVGAVALFFAVVVFFYAPRPDVWTALGSPAALPGLLNDATVVPAEKFYDSWVAGSHQDHDYLPYLYDLLETLAYGGPVVVAFAAVGFVVDRYSGQSRGLVAFATFWGLASVVGYPIATDIQAPWAAVHVVVPLAVPGAVGLGVVYRTMRESIAVEDAVSTGLAAVLLLSAATGAAAANASYMDSTEEADKEVLQWAQPGNDVKETLERVHRVSDANEGTDILYYGTTPPGSDNVRFYVEDESSLNTAPPGGPSWHSRLPLPWYFERYGAEVNSTPPDYGAAKAATDAPPVVVAFGYDREELEPELDGYTAYQHRFKLWGEDVVFFIDESALDSASRSPSEARTSDPLTGAA